MMQTINFSQPPPPMPNLSVPPPTIPHHFSHRDRYHSDRGGGHRHYYQPFRPYPLRPPPGLADPEFDGKRLRKSVMRKTVDYNSAVIKMIEGRLWQRDYRDRRFLQPDVLYYPDLEPPPSYIDNPINSVTTKFVKTATNKMRCPIFCMAWTPEGRRLVTGASSGEFTLWNGLTFNFETILQAHDSPVRTMVWSHNDIWMVTGDHAGYVKYWQSNMNNVKMFQAHKEAIRGLSFCPTDHKFVTCSDDGTLRIWDFLRYHEERILRGHGADVKCVHWHPQKGLIISGSKDNQQPVKLWDPKTGQSLATLHAHKSTVMDIKWNNNGNWLMTASRDHLLKLFDLRNLSQEVQTFRGHKKEASSVAWHPYHEGLFASGGSDGAILFWHVGADKEVGAIEQAHDSIVWTLAWHPLGHILCSGSNDHTSKFWTRNRPGDRMTDKYNLNTHPTGLNAIEDMDIEEPAAIPGMGPEDKVVVPEKVEPPSAPVDASSIPGLDISESADDKQKATLKKVPYSKPIPKNFQAQWNETGQSAADGDQDDADKVPLTEVITQIIESNPPPGVIPLADLKPEAIIVYGKVLPVEGNPILEEAIAAGPDALHRLINSGQLEELDEVLPYMDNRNPKDLEQRWRLDIVDLPPPLPSSLFAEQYIIQSVENAVVKGFINKFKGNEFIDSNNQDSSQNTFAGNYADEDMRTVMLQQQFAQQNAIPDQDMRFASGDVDLRQPPSLPVTDMNFSERGEFFKDDVDFRQIGPRSSSMGFNDITKDEDMRNHHFINPKLDDYDMRHFSDKDLRTEYGISGQSIQPELIDQDLRLNPVPSHSKPGLLGSAPNLLNPIQNSNFPNTFSPNVDVDSRIPNFSPGFTRESAGLSRELSLNTSPQFTSGYRPPLLDSPKWGNLRNNRGENSLLDLEASNDSSRFPPPRTAPGADRGSRDRIASSLKFSSRDSKDSFIRDSASDFDDRRLSLPIGKYQKQVNLEEEREEDDEFDEHLRNIREFDNSEEVSDTEDIDREDMYESQYDDKFSRNERYSSFARSRGYERGFRRGDNIRGSPRGAARGRMGRGAPRVRRMGRSRGRGVNQL